MSRISIAVVGLADGPEASAGPAILASLNPERFQRVGVIADPTEAGAYRPRLLDRIALLPAPGTPGFLTSMLSLIAELDICALIPGTPGISAELETVAMEFAAAGATLISPLSGASFDGRLLETARKAAIPVLGRISISEDFEESLEFNLACASGILQAENGQRRKVFDLWEAIRGAESMRGDEISISPWNPLQVFEVAVVADNHFRPVATAAVRVLADDDHLRPWLAVTVDNPSLIQVAARLCEELQIAGPAQMLFQMEGTGYRAVSVQPGFPLWIEVTRAAGPDLIGRAIDLALEVVESSAQSSSASAPSIPTTHSEISSVPAGILFSQTPEDLVVQDQHPLKSELSANAKPSPR